MAPFLQWLGPVVAALHLQTVRHVLRPHFNSLPLQQHKAEIAMAFGIISVLSRFIIATRVRPPTMLFMAAYAAAAPALARSGRWVAEACGALGPEWGAAAAQVALTGPVVALLFPFCTPPVTRAGAFRPLVSICATAIPVCMLAWASDLIEGNEFVTSALSDEPELGLLGMCMIFNALSVIYLWVPEEASPIDPPAAVPASVQEEKPQGAKKAGKKETAVTPVAPTPAPTPAARAPRIRSPTPITLGLRALPLLTVFMGFAAHKDAPFSMDGVRIHSSVASTSGRVIVGDNLETGYRYLRADHTLVGGVWIQETPGDVLGVGAKLGDSVFATMPLQEVGLLAREPASNDRVLVLGLGAGIGASYYAKRGLEVDVVEYDEAVYNAARDLFGLVPPKEVFIEDGARFVYNRAQQAKEASESADKYAYIVHDVFSAGGMPARLFTQEFWAEAKSILKPDGLVVMNIAGPLNGTLTRRIVATLTSEIPHCRAFSDGFTPDSKDDHVKNLVFVCSPQAPVSFRKPTRADAMGSQLRARVYGSFEGNEVALSEILKAEGEEEQDEDLILHRGVNAAKWDLELAKDVWESVRALMPTQLWITY